MILLDFRQIANVTFHSGFKYNGYDTTKFKHQFLNYALSLEKKFSKFGDMVICLDSSSYWRKEYFPYYKGQRKAQRAKSEVDFKKMYEMFDELTTDLENNFPWKMVHVEKAEADDIIGYLATKYHMSEPIMIISADKDFLQLQQFPNVSQYSPMAKKLISEKHPEICLREKILRGDSGDGVPNCKTRDDIFLSEGKSASITKVWLEPLLTARDFRSLLTEQEKQYYDRNETLIDLSKTPKEIKQAIDASYNNSNPEPKSKIVPYLIENDMTNLLDSFI